MDAARVGILSFQLTPDTQSEEARKETQTLLAHFDSLCRKEGKSGASETIQTLNDYYTRSVEARQTIREKIAAVNLGYNLDTHMHVFYEIGETSVVDTSVQYNAIVGYITYYDDGQGHNPVIYIGDRYVTEKFRSKGFFRGVIQNLMASHETRSPLFKTDILTCTRADIDLFVSLGFSFVRPYGTTTLTREEASELSTALIKEVKETSLSIDTLVERYKSLLHPQSELFQMIYVKPLCHSCLSKNESLLRCIRCQTAYYCTPVCQRKDWSTHKTVCCATRI